eukprot:PITA_20518
MTLVTSSSFSILLNGSPLKIFNPSRGLRQGDPLFPFLFILMMEGLGLAIKAAKVEGKIQGLRLTWNGNALSHQSFVDDTMLQGIPTVKESLAYKQVLKEFSMAVGIEVSLSKSKIFFFNTNIAIQRNISRILGFQREMLPSKYLGVPSTNKPLSKTIWEPVVNKIKNKTWKWITLPAPKGVLQTCRNIQKDFLWGKGEEKKKWALVAWENICKPKSHGGLGLDDPAVLIEVLGQKLWWRWIKYLTSPWAQIWKQKYANNWQDKDHIRIYGIIKGSHIWNKSWENRAIV